MRIYIMNTSKPYDEDEDGYSGAWFTCPVDIEEVKETLGLESEDEWEIEDYELPFSIDGNTKLWEINALCRIVQDMEGTPIEAEMKEIQHAFFSSFEEMVEHKDDIICYSDCDDMEDVARYFIEETGVLGEVPASLQNYIDYEAYGRDLELAGSFLVTSHGVFEYAG